VDQRLHPYSSSLLRGSRVEENQLRQQAGCDDCSIRSQCTAWSFRTVSCLENEAVLDRMASRLAKRPGVLDRRRETVEHPFGSRARNALNLDLIAEAADAQSLLLLSNGKRYRDQLGLSRLQHRGFLQAIGSALLLSRYRSINPWGEWPGSAACGILVDKHDA
jgi:hypothetical protein